MPLDGIPRFGIIVLSMSGVQRINEQHGHARSTDGTVVQLSDGAKVKVWPLGGKDRTEPLLDALHDAPGLSSHIEPADSFEFLASWLRVLVYDARGSGQSDLKGPLTNEPWIADVDELRQDCSPRRHHLNADLSYMQRVGRSGNVRPRRRLMWWLSFLQFRPGVPDSAPRSCLAWHMGVWTSRSAASLRDSLDGRPRQSGPRPTGTTLERGPPRRRRLRGELYGDSDDVTPPETESKAFQGTVVNQLHHGTQNAAFSYSVPRFDVRSRLGEIKAPMLVIVGRHDAVCTVSDAEELHRGISNSELAIFEKSGHSPPSEKPEAFRERLIKFLDDQKL